MHKSELIELNSRVYKITLLFPKKEPLRYMIRELSDKIVADYISWEMSHNQDNDLLFEIEKHVAILNAYLETVKWQNWVSYFDILELEEEFKKVLEKSFENIIQQEKREFVPLKKAIEAKIVKKTVLDERKQKIMDILKVKERIQVWEANEIFPKVSKRTIRRDFVELLNLGFIERLGEKSSTFYRLKSIDKEAIL